ncbi:MAG: methylmalonyl-CoA epimerase [Ignavibacteria bacterium]|jgi:methylmalonyl-CoA/ethylmalonyl-CoA epimerase|nr:methylmalonyl-CoA epimerase [Ignavibacteria bacterium]
MIKGINHIGIAVTDLEASIETFRKIFQFESVHREIVEDQKVEIASFKVGNVLIELTLPTSPESPIAKFIERNGGKGGLHHLAFETDNVEEELARIESEGIQLIDKKPRLGAHDMMIAFMHPKSTNGVLTEICQPK